MIMSSDALDKAASSSESQSQSHQSTNARPLSDTTTTTNTTKKLRLSCDNCHAAKVKCTKERPLCSRCASSGTSCVYSKSRRAGKPKGCGKKNNINKAAMPMSGPTITPTDYSYSSLPDSPLSLSDTRMSMDFDEASWGVDISGTDIPRRSSTLDQTFTASDLASTDSTRTTASLDPTLTQKTFHHAGSGLDVEEPFGSAFTTTSFFPTGTDFKLSPDWMSGPCMDMDTATATATNSHQMPPFVTTDGSNFQNLSSSSSMGNMVAYSDFSTTTSSSSDASALDDSGIGSSNTSTSLGSSPPPCNCSGALQDILSALNAQIPSFDKFLAINKSAELRMAHVLSCHCLPDISSVMLLSVIITRMVHCYKKIRNGPNTINNANDGSDSMLCGDVEGGVTMGTLKMDSEDEYQIKMVLIRSELRKIKALMTRFRDRFEDSLHGADRRLYEANMSFLEFGLDDTIKGL